MFFLKKLTVNSGQDTNMLFLKQWKRIKKSLKKIYSLLTYSLQTYLKKKKEKKFIAMPASFVAAAPKNCCKLENLYLCLIKHTED